MFTFFVLSVSLCLVSLSCLSVCSPCLSLGSFWLCHVQSSQLRLLHLARSAVSSQSVSRPLFPSCSSAHLSLSLSLKSWAEISLNETVDLRSVRWKHDVKLLLKASCFWGLTGLCVFVKVCVPMNVSVCQSVSRVTCYFLEFAFNGDLSYVSFEHQMYS